MRLLLLVLVLLLCVGCSPSAAIARNATDMSARAQEDIAAWDRVEKIHPDLAGEAKAGRDRAKRTVHGASDTLQLLTGVEDSTPWWASLLGYLAVAVIVVGIVFVLAQTGIGTALRVALGWIPRRKESIAALALDTIDTQKPETNRELISALRQDPEFDVAYKRASARRKAERDASTI